MTNFMLMRTGSIAAIIVFWKFFISETFSNCASCNGANAQGRSAGSSGFYHACAFVIIHSGSDSFVHKGDGAPVIFNDESVYLADPSFLTMFYFPLISGDTKTALNEPKSIVIYSKYSRTKR